MRRHGRVLDDVAGLDGDFARDVSRYPETNELLLVTDVLVTDYSSVLYDFACTGRPVVFFAPDLDDYRERLRGLYLDPSAAPGPVLGSTDDVATAIRDLVALRAEYAATYSGFVREHCAYDDGKAAARVVDRVFRADAQPSGVSR